MTTEYNVDNWVYTHQTLPHSISKDDVEQDFRESLPYYSYRLKGVLPENISARILDLPCGDGRFLYFLRQHGYNNTIGYDIDTNRISTGRLLDLPVNHGDVFEYLIDQPENSIDCIISMDFLEHLEKHIVLKWLELVFSRLSKEGIFLLRMPCADSLFGCRDIYNDFSHKWGATSGALKRLLSFAGFSNIIVFGEDPIFARWWDILRVVLSKNFRFFASVLFRLMGVSRPVIWSSSMWAVCKKPQ
jgi:SAM-dependent methyltransferase